MKKVLGTIVVIFLITLAGLLNKKNDDLKKEILTYKEKINRKPFISISRLRIDSIGLDGTIFTTELHAGEAGSGGDGSIPVVFDSCFESKLWSEYPYLKDDAYILSVSSADTSYKELITPSW